MSVGNGQQARQNWFHGFDATVKCSSSSTCAVFCFAFLAGMPGLYRKKSKACQHVNSKECKRCGGAEGAGTTASEGYGVSVVHVTCSYGYE